ncbi:FAD-dependent oxidoreductase [Pedobacter aquatilis]|uniref:FAD-dependent oxidoreductase n=1 Tax=Pedobacter aquatilis TaxID=351343 RepID=UPI0025B5C137|nr:FAD-dependent oxidoreductase [Pedobacter aquatilis]MDN3585677.1 FAD-dependent oxidoreductase [Pedobacter aquatilis]
MNEHQREDILRRSIIPEHKYVYILGNTAKRVTFHAQQHRAFNLICALIESGRLKPGARIGVVGGGLAGMTAALAAKIRGFEVTLYERGQVLMPMWSGNDTRYVHPQIYDWPKKGSNIELTNLPVLNWYAQSAQAISRQIMNEWKQYGSGIQVCLSTEVVELTDRDEFCMVRVNPHELKDHECVILATGFGIEKTEGILNAQTYWKNDSLHQSDSGKVKKYLISGCGDGGLIDALRLSLLNFNHREHSEEFLNHPTFDGVRQAILDAEDGLSVMPGQQASEELNRRYSTIPFPDELYDFLGSKLRNDTEVNLNGKNASPMSRDASVHNRVLVFLLTKLKKINYLAGKAGPYEPDSGQFKVTIAMQNGNTMHVIVDKVIIRHGPEQILQPLLGPNCTIPTSPLPDISCDKLWPEEYYNGIEVPTTNQKKYMADNIGSLQSRIKYDFSVGIGVTEQDGKSHYVLKIPDSKPLNYLADIIEHKGFPVIFQRVPELISAQYGTLRQQDNWKPRFEMGAPIANKIEAEMSRNYYGSLGAFVINAYGQLCVLSSSHAVSSQHYSNSNEVVLLYDRNSIRYTKFQSLGKLTHATHLNYNYGDFSEPNKMDAGLVVVDDQLSKTISYERINALDAEKIAVHQEVEKIGAGSGITKGIVSAVSCRIQVKFNDGYAVFKTYLKSEDSMAGFPEAAIRAL